MRVDDPETYNEPWSAVRRYRRAQQAMTEEVCAETMRICSTITSRSPTRRISEPGWGGQRLYCGVVPRGSCTGLSVSSFDVDVAPQLL
jgi:hypothetical protein